MARTITRPDRPSDLLRYVREEVLGGISQAELARRTGISQPSINRIERGNQPLTGDTAVALLLLGVDPELVLPLRGMCGYLVSDAA